MPRNALSAGQSRVPVYRSDAPSSMEAGLAVIGFAGPTGGPARTLGVGDGNADAIVTSHQDAILGPAQIRDAHGQP
jgi:hypothetical protein